MPVRFRWKLETRSFPFGSVVLFHGDCMSFRRSPLRYVNSWMRARNEELREGPNDISMSDRGV